MEEILKEARLVKAELDEGELALINVQTLRPLSADEVFTFRLAACDNQVDRDHERFTEATLEELAERFVGRTVLLDHQWSAGSQTARVYAGAVEPGPAEGVKRLVLRCYMPRTAQAEPIIAAIESGILRECSVGLAVLRALCSICGANQTETVCQHIPGREYDCQLCHMDLTVWPMCTRSPWWPSRPSRRPASSRASGTAARSRPQTVTHRGSPEQIARTGGTRPAWSWKNTDLWREAKYETQND